MGTIKRLNKSDRSCFTSPLHLIATYKPSGIKRNDVNHFFDYIYFHDCNLFAINHHMVLTQGLLDCYHISQDVINFLDGKKIHYKEFESLLDYDSLLIENGKLWAVVGRTRLEVELSEFSKTGISNNDLEKIKQCENMLLRDFEGTPNIIGLSYKLQQLLFQVLLFNEEKETIHYKFPTIKNGGIRVEVPYVEQIAIIMPVIV